MIYFEKVSKIYSDNTKALEDITLKIEPNEFVSIVGHSGAGKTTLIRMLLAEESPTDGNVYFGSTDIHSLNKRNMNKLRRKIGTIFQDFRLLPHKNVYENIAFAMEAAGKTDEEIAADVPHVLELVDLPKKAWNFPHELSGGEQQRVAIARAMLKDAPILVLDEATSALDSESEVAIQQALETLMEGRTVIAIAHRLSTLRKMDRVIVMEAGQIKEDGNHDSLAHSGGVYERLWNHQAGGFLQE
jgi:ABC-type multidrug transport system fused ATPase/permease subunit